jgi:hypothetical protein
MRPKPSTRDTRSSIKDKGVVTKDEVEVGDGLSSPGAPNDKPSSAVEVNFPTEAKDATNNEDKKMPAIEKDKASHGAKANKINQEDDSALQTSISPDTNLPSGLDVIAHAAANVDVQVRTDKVIVIDDVPEVRAVSVSSIDSSVYSFSGAKELYVPFEETINKTLTAKQRVQESLSRQRKLLKTYNKSFENGLMEMPLLHFQNWFFGLRFANAVMHPKESNLTTWHFRVIAIDPSSDGYKHSPVIATNLPKFQKMVTAFYENLFAPSKEILMKIERAVANDKTIMIAAVRLHPSAKADQTFCTYVKKLIVVAAVSYEMYPNPTTALATDVFVSLMGVASSAVPHPTAIHSWRRNGIGIFLFVQVIKRCASMKANAKQISIFLQCQEASSLHFYSMIGFHKINSHSEDGFDLLPKHMQMNLKSLRPNDPGHNSGFIFYDKDSDLKPSFLMHLRPGGLRHHEEEIDLELEAQKSVFWFRYPAPRLQDGKRMEYLPKDFHDAFLGLPLLQNLLPKKSEFTTLLPPASLPIKGEISLLNRIEHSKAKGTKWMASGEMDLMLSILSSDGRYEDLAYILPYTLSATVRACYQKHCLYQEVVNLLNENKQVPPDELDKLILQRFKASRQTIHAEYLEHTKHLLKNVIVPNLGMLEKKILVFPSNMKDAHWTVTFVFNASYIQHDIDAEVESGWLQPCFFRYCSLVTDGSRYTSTAEGIPWFLNFCYSYELHERTKQHSTDPMKWFAPFGSSSEEFLLGTRNFPALRLCNRNHLPHQKDGFNCGIGACAGIAIILRNFLKNENIASFLVGTSRRDKESMIFLKDEKKHEHYMLFPDNFFEPVPTKIDLVWGNYLDCLREEWFVLFDRLAHLQYVTLPQRINRQNAVDPVFHATLKALTWPDKEERAKRLKVPRKKTITRVASIETDLPRVGPSLSGVSTLPQISQTQDSMDVHMEGIDADLNMEGIDADLNAANDNDPKNVTIIRTDVDNKELIGGTFTSGDGSSSLPYTKALIKDPEELKPVRLHMTIKKRKGDLLERLKLNRVKFSDDEEDAINAKDDPENQFYEIDEPVKKQKFSTQTTKTIEAFRQKYRTMLEDEDEDVQAITPEFTAALDEFIATSLAKWKWSSDAEHKANIKEWADKMKEKDCSTEKRPTSSV